MAQHGDTLTRLPFDPPGPGAGPGRWSATQTPVEERGVTTIPAGVVARIAEQVASEHPRVGGSAGGVLGLRARRDFDARPTAECDLYGAVAVLRLDVGVAFPVDLVETCRDLRAHVRDRVGALTGLEVGRLDVTISWLNPATGTRGPLR
ncbi:Asp23/Gls24 family envelope stress response protein [Dietzia sp. CH92]|uniref:Asp23/Gls24 family envelope stress response protein n=1 Tax=Dietzia sp. CH92 TaxID=3051823 RepID=UPI0028D34DE3|nr:Asp23/Gls24 family envelope stress response protein [Dietzia sp. CH92]